MHTQKILFLLKNYFIFSISYSYNVDIITNIIYQIRSNNWHEKKVPFPDKSSDFERGGVMFLTIYFLPVGIFQIDLHVMRQIMNQICM